MLAVLLPPEITVPGTAESAAPLLGSLEMWPRQGEGENGSAGAAGTSRSTDFHEKGEPAVAVVVFHSRSGELGAAAIHGLKLMNERIHSRRVTVVNEQGLHMRPLDIFVRCASQFDAQIGVIRDTERADGKSILSILTLGAEKGTQLLIEASGQDAEAALAALVALVESGFEEDAVKDSKRGT